MVLVQACPPTWRSIIVLVQGRYYPHLCIIYIIVVRYRLTGKLYYWIIMWGLCRMLLEWLCALDFSDDNVISLINTKFCYDSLRKLGVFRSNLEKIFLTFLPIQSLYHRFQLNSIIFYISQKCKEIGNSTLHANLSGFCHCIALYGGCKKIRDSFSS